MKEFELASNSFFMSFSQKPFKNSPKQLNHKILLHFSYKKNYFSNKTK
ncbi:hypothetical protein MCERE19_04343 [Spirosomataceae bacterium]